MSRFAVQLLMILVVFSVGCKPQKEVASNERPGLAAQEEVNPAVTASEGTKEPPVMPVLDPENGQSKSDIVAKQVVPLAEDPRRLIRLNPDHDVWVDKQQGAVILVGKVCQRNAPLEMFACLRNTKEHESIVSVNTLAQEVHAALLVIGAKPGAPVSFDPKYRPATGDAIEIVVRWVDQAGEIKSALAQQWVRSYDTKKQMQHDWVFAGSRLWKDGETGQEVYLAEHGDFICVANFPTAMLDLPIRSSDQASDLLYEAFTERIPPLGTDVTLILRPKAKTSPGKPEK